MLVNYSNHGNYFRADLSHLLKWLWVAWCLTRPNFLEEGFHSRRKTHQSFLNDMLQICLSHWSLEHQLIGKLRGENWMISQRKYLSRSVLLIQSKFGTNNFTMPRIDWFRTRVPHQILLCLYQLLFGRFTAIKRQTVDIRAIESQWDSLITLHDN